MSIGFELKQAIKEVLGQVAGDDYEGWNDYWDDEMTMEKRIIELLEEWQALCKEKKQ